MSYANALVYYNHMRTYIRNGAEEVNNKKGSVSLEGKMETIKWYVQAVLIESSDAEWPESKVNITMLVKYFSDDDIEFIYCFLAGLLHERHISYYDLYRLINTYQQTKHSSADPIITICKVIKRIGNIVTAQLTVKTMMKKKEEA